MGFDATVPALRTGIVDAVIAGMTINEKRKKFVDFSDPYYTSGLIIMVPSSDTTTKSIKDLEGKDRCSGRYNRHVQSGKVPSAKWSLLLMLPRLSWNSKTAALTL